MDEPTAELDSAATLSFYRALDSFRGTITMIVAEHKLELLAGFADRLVLLKDGMVQGDDEPARVIVDENLLASCGYEQPAVYRFLKRIAAIEGLHPVPPVWSVEAATDWLRSAIAVTGND